MCTLYTLSQNYEWSYSTITVHHYLRLYYQVIIIIKIWSIFTVMYHYYSRTSKLGIIWSQDYRQTKEYLLMQYIIIRGYTESPLNQGNLLVSKVICSLANFGMRRSLYSSLFQACLLLSLVCKASPVTTNKVVVKMWRSVWNITHLTVIFF